MTSRPRARRRRSLAATKGWSTRRARAKARSIAAKKGWRTRAKTRRITRARQRNTRIGRRPRVSVAVTPRPTAKTKTARRPPIVDWLQSYDYKSAGSHRAIDFIVATRDQDLIEGYVDRYIERHDLGWIYEVPWSDVKIMKIRRSTHREGYVTTR